jgi:hypothetical protein
VVIVSGNLIYSNVAVDVTFWSTLKHYEPIVVTSEFSWKKQWVILCCLLTLLSKPLIVFTVIPPQVAGIVIFPFNITPSAGDNVPLLLHWNRDSSILSYTLTCSKIG